jgi:hypothetical protein
MAAGTRQRGRWPVVAVHGSVAATVLVLVAVLALVVKPPAPPGIAAFAPQASKPITKAPPAQSARFGTGAGQCAAGQVCTGPTTAPTTGATASPSESPKALRGAAPPGLQCYTWPDGTVTQTFDPQSPPCISRWDDSKGNGGATSPGVTATEVRIAYPKSSSAVTQWPGPQAIADFFNTHFQFYGRKIKIVTFDSQQATQQAQATGFNDPTMQRADAAAITQLKVFGTFDFVDPMQYSWSLPVFRDVLTKHKIVSVAGGEMVPYATSPLRAPYEWSYYPSIDKVMRNVATVACRQLANKPAIHSGDAALKRATRKFAVVLPTDNLLGGPLPGLSAALSILDGCGVHDPRVVRFTGTRDDLAPLTAEFRELQEAGVTSMIFFPYTGASTPQSPPSVASTLAYHPEWVLIGWNQFLVANMLNNPQEQSAHAFGVGVWNKLLPAPLEFWAQSYFAGGGNQGNFSAGGLPGGRAFYNELLLLASGIQMAGPNLTPETFAKGLQETEFGNPGAGAPPFYQGTVGFADDTTMVDDLLEFWLDTRMSGSEASGDKNVNESRSNCYVAMGRRWRLESWPTTDDFYKNTACR